MLAKATVKDYMSSNLITFTPDMDVLDAIQKLLKNHITGAPVVDEHGNLIGTLSESDCMQVVVHSAYNQSRGGKISDYMSSDVMTVDVDASIVDVAELFAKYRIRSVPVVDDVDMVGVISRVDVLKALDCMR